MKTKHSGSPSLNEIGIECLSLGSGKSKMSGSNRDAGEDRVTRRNRQNKQEWEKFEGLFHKGMDNCNKEQRSVYFLIELPLSISQFTTLYRKFKPKRSDCLCFQENAERSSAHVKF
jgi:hypothetical protein